jgi:hypothetical protein
MIRAENFIVRGSGFISWEDPVSRIGDLKKLIRACMMRFGFHEDSNNPFPIQRLFDSSYEDPFLSLYFIINRPDSEPSFIETVKLSLHLLSQQQKQQNDYFRFLNTKRDDVTFEISILLSCQSHQEKKGFLVDIIIRPAIFFKLSQRQKSVKSVSEFDYSLIKSSTEEQAHIILKSLNAIILTPPAVLSEYSPEICRSIITDKLANFGFNKVSTIMMEGRNKLIRGKVKDSLVDLRSALEIFTEHVARRSSEKSKPQD